MLFPVMTLNFIVFVCQGFPCRVGWLTAGVDSRGQGWVSCYLLVLEVHTRRVFQKAGYKTYPG